jgi:regulatory protein YycH of two-component signal transduction system YycFG
MFVFIVKLGFPMTTIIIGYEIQSTPFPWGVEPNTWLAPFVAMKINKKYSHVVVIYPF